MCAECGAANPVGNKFCGQCAASLRVAPPARFSAPSTYTPKHLAEKILTSQGALQGERKTVTVLFADHKGSMKNVEMSIAGNILTITVDLTKEFGPSSSGKTIIIASTEGNVSVPDREEKVGLNVYRKK